ncbi:MAG: HlyD family efflux transporter periplasmic adaptor subunit [Dorea sp.]|jgi:multidrug efflux pump subunit AcrA (membrane-fusion protein)|nr:HlyD family efflux transporter periplasmic adaptor subunit [Dorea sp.]
MRKGKLKKRNFKKKIICITAVSIILLLGAAVFAISARARNMRTKAAGKAAVQSTSVTRGNITNTIDASGNLEAAKTIDITVPAGIKVDKVTAESGDKVTKGQSLAKLNKTSVTRLLVEVKDSIESIDSELDKSGLSSLEKEELTGEKSELEKTEKKLTALYKNPVITAPTDGIIGTVSIFENAETSANTSSANSGVSDNADQNNTSLSQMSAKNTSGSSTALLFLTADVSDNSPEQTEDELDSNPQPEIITDYSNLSIQAPQTGKEPQTSIPETDMYTGTISWDLSNRVFQSGTVYTATVVLTAKNGYTFSEKNLPIIKDASFNWNIYNSGEGNTLKIVAKYEKTAAAQNVQDDTPNQSSSVNSSDDSKIEDKTDDRSDNSSTTPGNNTKGTAPSNITGAKSNGSSGSISGSSSSSKTTSGAASGSSSEYSSYEMVAFTIVEQDNAKIIVDVDELDILSVEKDQTAVVVLDAVENERYTGTVTKINNTASAGSGSTKYEVEITVPMDENMRMGMSASAAIQISTSENTLLLPMSALQQKGEETFVYTKKDKDGSLSGETAVETGLSDGQNVEILNGLKEGDTIYYTRTTTDNKESFNKDFGFPGPMGKDEERSARPADGGRNRPSKN